MRVKVKCALALASLLVAIPAAALAAQPSRGRTYAGVTSHGKRPIKLLVAKDGKTVTVRIAAPPLYCEGGGVPTEQLTRPASISASGSFRGSIAYRLLGHVRFHAYFSGRFTSKTVAKGTLRSQYPAAPSCSGSTTFTARRTAH